jgi:DNA-binding CsgD family transcriptional regulator
MEKQIAIVVSSNARCLPDWLREAIRHEFSWLDVECVSSVKALCMPPQLGVPLILVDDSQFDDLRAHHARLRVFHPHSTLALLRQGSYGLDSGAAILQSNLVRGVLPMDLKLDVWLAAFRIVLLGGEYFPRSFQQSAITVSPGPPPSAAASGVPPPHSSARTAPGLPGAGVAQTQALTHREFQILALVSLGLQNKLIAARLALSEHTVKIHLHNIISKLGVHNRTEAASIFLEGRGTMPCAPAADRTPMEQPGLVR